jgi:hypothetical protein
MPTVIKLRQHNTIMTGQSYRPRHQISRQFTEAELAVSDRATEHLTQEVDSMPAPRLSSGGSAREAYGWLEKDLERRDKETARLAREMQLAEAQSLRQQLDAEARQDADRKAEAADGVAFIAGWQEKGFRSMDEAKQAYYKQNPSASMNPDFNAASNEIGRNFKTDQQREIEETDEQLSLVTGKLALGKAEITREFYEKNPEAFKKMVNAQQNSAVLGALNAEQQAQMTADLQKESYRRTVRNNAKYGQSADGDPLMAVQQRKAFKDADMNVRKPSLLQGFFPPNSPAMLMATDIFFLKNQLGEDERSALEANYNVLTDPNSTDEQKFVAQDEIENTSADYLAYSQKLKEEMDAETTFRETLPAAFKAMNDGVKAGYSVLEAYQKNPSADPQVGIDAVVDNAKRTLMGVKSEFEAKRIPLDRYSEVLKDIHAIGAAKTDPGDEASNVNAVRQVAQDVHTKLRELIDDALTRERIPETIDEKPKAGEKSPVLKPITDTDLESAIKAVGSDKNALRKHFEENGFAVPSF